MANMPENLGLEFLFENEESVMGIAAYTAKEGKPVRGYGDTLYFCKYTGTCEFWVSSVFDEEARKYSIEKIHSHGGNENVLEMRHIGINLTPEDSASTEHIGMLEKADGSAGMLPIEIINADVLPSYMRDDVITLQTICYPLDINYYKDKEDYVSDQPADKNGQKWSINIGSMLPFEFLMNHNPDTYEVGKEYPSDSYVHFAAEVTEVYYGTFKAGEEEEMKSYIRCFADTVYGKMEFDHTLEQVPEEQRGNIKAGSIISGVCIISGDAAIKEYSDGAIKDFEHDLKLLRYVFSEGNAEKLAGVLTPVTGYTSEASGRDYCGPEEIIDRMNYVHESHENGRKYIADFATVVEAGENSDYPAGTQCIALGLEGENNYESLAFIDVDDKGMITDIFVSADTSYRFSVEKPSIRPQEYSENGAEEEYFTVVDTDRNDEPYEEAEPDPSQMSIFDIDLKDNSNVTGEAKEADKLTPCQINLIGAFKSLGLDKETTLGIMSVLNTSEKRKAMENYLIAEYDKGNKRPTEQQILRHLKEILRKYGGLNEGVE